MTDALKIARWAFPNYRWEEDKGGSVWRCDNACRVREPVDLIWIHLAELVLIERGLGTEYGARLAEQVGHPCSGPWAMKPHEALALATAPLDARIKAMVAVIDAQEKQ